VFKTFAELVHAYYVPNMTSDRNYDLAIVGAGPAGLALAAEALDLGARVAVVDPEPERQWTQTWCAFAPDLPTGVPIAERWESAEVRLDDRTVVDPRPYVQVDGSALQAQLLERLRGADLISGTVSGSTSGGLRLDDGTEIRATPVDCSGVAQILGGAGRPTAFQTAWGLEIETDGHPWNPESAVWMDLTALQAQPSFLYALPRSSTRVFVEETSLAARPAMPLALLERRLTDRLERLGVKVTHLHATERCSIPLDMPTSNGLAFGAAAGMVHPATGYLLSRVLAGAQSFAAAIAAGGADAELQKLRGARSRGLHLLGLDVLVGCDGAELAGFFDTFFALPPTARERFLAVQPRILDTSLTMGRMFLSAPIPLKRRLAAPLFFSREPLPEVACPHS
jgi:lycopene beta-cyclase